MIFHLMGIEYVNPGEEFNETYLFPFGRGYYAGWVYIRNIFTYPILYTYYGLENSILTEYGLRDLGDDFCGELLVPFTNTFMRDISRGARFHIFGHKIIIPIHEICGRVSVFYVLFIFILMRVLGKLAIRRYRRRKLERRRLTKIDLSIRSLANTFGNRLKGQHALIERDYKTNFYSSVFNRPHIDEKPDFLISIIYISSIISGMYEFRYEKDNYEDELFYNPKYMIKYEINYSKKMLIGEKLSLQKDGLWE